MLLFSLLGLLLLALFIVIFPLLPRKQALPVGQEHRDAQLVIYRSRLIELKQDLAAGVLSDQQYEAAVVDLDREIAESGGLAPEVLLANDSIALPWVIPVFAGLLLPAAVIGFYLLVGEPNATGSQTQAAAHGMSAAGGIDELEEFRVLSQQLEQRLIAQPQDSEAWVLLARTRMFLRDYPGASEAYGMALQQGYNQDPRMLASYADVLAQVQGGLQGRPAELVAMALELDPNHGQSLWLAGTIAFQQGDYAKARLHWEHLINVLPADSSDIAILRLNLAEVERLERGSP